MSRIRNRAICVLLASWLAGSPSGASGEDSFTIAVAPDLQQEVLDGNDTRLANRFRWLVDNRQELNLKCMLQVGDFMNWDTPDHIQYERASAAVKILDEAGLPFVFAIGNHDTQATGGTPEKPGGSARPGNTHDNQRDTAIYNRYFPLARFTMLGGVYEPGKIDNAWHTFQAGGLDWLVINLELWPRRGAVEWAKTIVEQHPSHNVVLLTHSFLRPTRGGAQIEQTNGGYGDNSPQFVFDELVKPYPNFRLVFCGHAGVHGYRLDRGEHGNAVYQFMQTYHDSATNPVRLFTIDTKEGSLKSRVFCPSIGKDKDDGSTLEIKGVEWVRPAAEPLPETGRKAASRRNAASHPGADAA